MSVEYEDYEPSFETEWVTVGTGRITTRLAAEQDASTAEHLDWLREQTGPGRFMHVHHRDASALDQTEHLARLSTLGHRLDSERAIAIHRLVLAEQPREVVHGAVVLFPEDEAEPLRIWLRWSLGQRELAADSERRGLSTRSFDLDEHLAVEARLREWASDAE